MKDGESLKTYSLGEGSILVFKDLGPQVCMQEMLDFGRRSVFDFAVWLGLQIGYSTVFFWEYFGPLIVYPLFYALPGVFYSTRWVENPN